MNSKHHIGIVALVLLALGGWYIMSNTSNTVNAPTTVENPTSNTETEAVAPTNNKPVSEVPTTSTVDTSDNAVTVSVKGTDHTFDVKNIAVKKGQTVTIDFVNDEGFHDWVIDEFEGARTPKIQAGQSASVTFVADKAGTFEYYCSVGNHRARGMVGSLVVTE
jgi:plastocyanin